MHASRVRECDRFDNIWSKYISRWIDCPKWVNERVCVYEWQCIAHTHYIVTIIILYRQMRAILCLILFHCEFLSELLLIRPSATPHTCNCYYSTLAHLIPRACATILQIWYTYFFFFLSLVLSFIIICSVAAIRFLFYLFHSNSRLHFETGGAIINRYAFIMCVVNRTAVFVHLIGLSMSCSLFYPILFIVRVSLLLLLFFFCYVYKFLLTWIALAASLQQYFIKENRISQTVWM